MRYLTRQVAVDAIQWDGKEDTFGQIRDMLGDEYELSIIDETSNLIQMDTEMGVTYPEPGEWIVWDGEFAQAYKDARFKEMFAPATEFILDAQNVEITMVQESSAIPKTQEEKIAFRQDWDSRVERGIR